MIVELLLIYYVLLVCVEIFYLINVVWIVIMPQSLKQEEKGKS